MLTINFWFSLLLVSLSLTCGCTPAGPRALLDGKKLIEQGKYSRAVEKLRNATSLLATNAQAWNYLGLACHYAGQGDEAERAYKRALALNRDLSEAHYNLACLRLAQNRPEKTEAATYQELFAMYRRLYFAFGQQISTASDLSDILPELRRIAARVRGGTRAGSAAS